MPPLSPQGPGSHTKLPVSQREPAMLTGGSAAARWDSATLGAGLVLSNGSLTLTKTASNAVWNSVRSTVKKSTGKWYWELTSVSGNDDDGYILGIAANTLPTNTFPGGVVNSIGYQIRPGGATNALRYANGAAPGGVAPIDGHIPGHVIGIKMDCDGTPGSAVQLQNYDNVDSGSGGGVMATVPAFAAAALFRIGNIITANFGATPFVYPIPAGYLALDS